LYADSYGEEGQFRHWAGSAVLPALSRDDEQRDVGFPVRCINV